MSETTCKLTDIEAPADTFTTIITTMTQTKTYYFTSYEEESDQDADPEPQPVDYGMAKYIPFPVIATKTSAGYGL